MLAPCSTSNLAASTRSSSHARWLVGKTNADRKRQVKKIGFKFRLTDFLCLVYYMIVSVAKLFYQTSTYSHIQCCVALWVLDVGWGTLFEKQLDEAVVSLGRCSVEGCGFQLVSGIGVCPIFQQHQGNLNRGKVRLLRHHWQFTFNPVTSLLRKIHVFRSCPAGFWEEDSLYMYFHEMLLNLAYNKYYYQQQSDFLCSNSKYLSNKSKGKFQWLIVVFYFVCMC